MGAIKKLVDTVVAWLCIVLFSCMTVLVTYQVITRYFFNQPSAVSEILAKYMFIWVVLFGAAYVFGTREHMNIAFLKDKLPTKIRLVVEMLGELVIVLFGYFVMYEGGLKGAMRQMSQIDPSLGIPMGVIYGAIPASGVLMMFYFIHTEMILFKQFKDALTSSPRMQGD